MITGNETRRSEQESVVFAKVMRRTGIAGRTEIRIGR